MRRLTDGTFLREPSLSDSSDSPPELSAVCSVSTQTSVALDVYGVLEVNTEQNQVAGVPVCPIQSPTPGELSQELPPGGQRGCKQQQNPVGSSQKKRAFCGKWMKIKHSKIFWSFWQCAQIQRLTSDGGTERAAVTAAGVHQPPAAAELSVHSARGHLNLNSRDRGLDPSSCGIQQPPPTAYL